MSPDSDLREIRKILRLQFHSDNWQLKELLLEHGSTSSTPSVWEVSMHNVINVLVLLMILSSQ